MKAEYHLETSFPRPKPQKMPFRNATHACNANVEAPAGVTATGDEKSPGAALETCNHRIVTHPINVNVVHRRCVVVP